jgi:hypothetical protein
MRCRRCATEFVRTWRDRTGSQKFSTDATTCCQPPRHGPEPSERPVTKRLKQHSEHREFEQLRAFRRPRLVTSLSWFRGGRSGDRHRNRSGGRPGVGSREEAATYETAPNRIPCRFLGPSGSTRVQARAQEHTGEHPSEPRGSEGPRSRPTAGRPGPLWRWFRGRLGPGDGAATVDHRCVQERNVPPGGLPHLTADSIIGSVSIVRVPTANEVPGESGPKCSNGYCWG